MMCLPQEIEWNIIKFMRHPVAEIVSEEPMFKYKFYKSMRVHGDAFDRGSADAYYWRDPCPHKVIDRCQDERGRYYDVRVEEEGLSTEEVEAYWFGFEFQEDRK